MRAEGAGAGARLCELKPQTKPGERNKTHLQNPVVDCASDRSNRVLFGHARCLRPHPPPGTVPRGFMMPRRVGSGGGRHPGPDIGPFKYVVGFGFHHALFSSTAPSCSFCPAWVWPRTPYHIRPTTSLTETIFLGRQEYQYA